jgi:hypothetical protein
MRGAEWQTNSEEAHTVLYARRRKDVSLKFGGNGWNSKFAN